jgi:hypothetical protein
MNTLNIEFIASLDPRIKANHPILIEFLSNARKVYAPEFIEQVKYANGSYKMRSSYDKALLASYLALELATNVEYDHCKNVINITPKASKTEAVASKKAEAQTIKLTVAIAGLLRHIETNGLEKAESYQILGEPVTEFELDYNYRQLIDYWHPDRNDSTEAEARTTEITSIYRRFKVQWDSKYRPTIPKGQIEPKAFVLAFAWRGQFSSASYWEPISKALTEGERKPKAVAVDTQIVTRKEFTKEEVIEKEFTKEKAIESPWDDSLSDRVVTEVSNELPTYGRKLKARQGETVYYFSTVREAAKSLSLNQKAIYPVLRGDRNQHKGYTFAWV